MSSFNFKNISAELETFCRVRFPTPDHSEPVNFQFAENLSFNDVQPYDEDNVPIDKVILANLHNIVVTFAFE